MLSLETNVQDKGRHFTLLKTGGGKMKRKGLNRNKKSYDFMDIRTKRALYSVVSFLGGVLLFNQFTDDPRILIIVGFIIGVIGYKLAR